MTRDLSGYREVYDFAQLRRDELPDDPYELFDRWFDEWAAAGSYDPAACVLATADADGAPSARYVQCRRADESGFVVYTNRESRKGHDLAANPRAALVFGWLEHERQVRIEGAVELVDDAESDAYWASRPRSSRLGSWASEQSEVLVDRSELDAHLRDVVERFGADEGDGPVPRPSWWGGYRIVPLSIEFWQGRPDRLHDRFRYRRASTAADAWEIERLSP